MYGANHIVIGEKAVEFGINNRGRLAVKKFSKFALDFKTGVRITFIGKIGGGKTWAIRGLLERAYLSGKYAVAICPDFKDEYISSREPAPKGQYSFLAEDEKPVGIDKMVSFKPKFFKTFGVRVQNDKDADGLLGKRKKLGFFVEDLSFSDLKEIFKVNDMTVNHANMVDELLLELKNKKVHITYESIIAAIDKNPVLTASSKASLKFKLKSFFNIGFFGEPAYDPVALLNSDYIPILNLERFKEVDKDGGASFVAVSVWHRRVISGRESGELKKKRVLFVMDETNRLIPDSRFTSVKVDVLDGVEEKRGYGVSYVFSYQTDIVPKEIMQNSNYVFVPFRAAKSAFKTAYTMTGVFKQHILRLDGHINHIKKRMKAVGKHSMLVIDTNNDSEHIVQVFSPMSHHDTKGT